MIEYSTFTLANGLRVVHHFDGTTNHVAVNVLYNVGARDESPEFTGMAHLFEHLMFGGSVNVSDYDFSLEMAGGTNNAWTSNDFTNFYDVVPVENVETAFWAESDRMLQLAFNPRSLEVQRKVVMEEFKQVCINKPYGDVGHLLRSILYTTHPYRYPTIGKDLSHIEKVTMGHVKEFFYSHYAPNNAVLSVAGAIEFDTVRALAEKWFGTIPRRDIAQRTYLPEPEITSARRLEVFRDVPQSRIIIAFPMSGYGTDEYCAADLLTDIFASGNSSRFYRELVMGTDLFTAADASILGSDEPGFIMLSAQVRGNSNEIMQCVEQALWAQIENIVEHGVSDYELQRALNRFESNRTFSQINYLAKSRDLAKSVLCGEDINQVIPKYRAVTTTQIQDVATKLLQPQRSATLIYNANT